mmetsp:Transcript_26428/g.83765  ORF Transcript_26428/g.83765 Transcript_26428/m.83765 type:complete len:393 (-) Transcript_26428:130-1308(-)
MDLSLLGAVGGVTCRGTETLGTCSGVVENAGDLETTFKWLRSSSPAWFREGADVAIAPMPLISKGSVIDTPPLWSGQSMTGDRIWEVCATAADTLSVLKSYFQDVVPSVLQVQAEAWSIKVLAFVGYVATHAQVSVYSAAGNEAQTIVVVQDASRQDVVRFDQWCGLVVRYLLDRVPVAQVGGAAVARCPDSGAMMDEGFEEDFLSELEDDWPLRVASALEAATSAHAAAREEGLGMLATWAATRPDARAAIAEGLAARPALLKGLLRQGTPVVELYPLSVVLKFATMQDAAALGFVKQEVVAMQGQDLPSIVAKELGAACAHLDGQAQGRSSSKDRYVDAVLSADATEHGAPPGHESADASSGEKCRRLPGMVPEPGAFRRRAPRSGEAFS